MIDGLIQLTPCKNRNYFNIYLKWGDSRVWFMKS